MEIIHPEIQEYIRRYSQHIRPELEELERETYLKVMLPQMISGAEQGTFLYQFTAALNPKLVVELGTFTGYSAICMAAAMQEGAKLVTLDVNQDIAHIPIKYFEKCNLDGIIDFQLVPGLDYLPAVQDESIDLLFMDADKKNYPKYFQIADSKMKSGGFILVDNILWNGRVTQKEGMNSDTQAIVEVTKMIMNHSQYCTTILPIRDGILMARKK
ncbi:MAG: O-methyltransferase [Chitinophagales bacterium]